MKLLQAWWCGFALSIALSISAAPATAQTGDSSLAAPKQEVNAGLTGPVLPAAALAEIDIVISKVIQAIRSNHFSEVLVLGAKRTDDKFSQLGMIVGDAFSASLVKQAAGFQVVSRGAIRTFLDKIEATPGEMLTDDWKDGICDSLDADSFVLVTLERVDGRKLRGSANLFASVSGPVKSLAGWKFELAADDVLRKENKVELRAVTPQQGIREPQCDYCPRPDFVTEAAKNAHVVEASVLLWVLVGTDGRATDVIVLKGAPYGMNAGAVDAVKRWKFKPARGNDGKPIARRTQVIMTYQRF
jgi:TonB family protein